MKFKAGQEVIDRFVIEKIIGKGSQATIYKAFDKQRSIQEALKQFQCIEFQDLELIRSEFRVVKMLQHPNIACDYDMFELEDCFLFTMEFINGLSLDKLVEQQNTSQISDILNRVNQDQFTQYIEFNENNKDLLVMYQSFMRQKIRYEMEQEQH